MSGEISVRSEPGKGAEFTLRLPFTSLRENSTPSKASSQLAGLSCLVVGDADTLADSFAIYLANDGAIVEQVSASADAQRWIATRPTGLHVVVIDSARRGPYSLDELRSVAARSDGDIHFIVIGRGKRRRCRTEPTGEITVDGNVLPRSVFLNIVSIAAGRTTDQCLQKLPDIVQSDLAVVAPLSREQASLQGRLILIAEDNEINQKVIQQQLALLGQVADIANNGREALKRWQGTEYAILITDLHMPEMDGYELTSAIRAGDTGKARKPIIAFTANALKGEAERCIALGMNDYLTKPVELKKLSAILNKWLPPASNPAITQGKELFSAEIGSVEKATHTSIPVEVNVLKAIVGDDEVMIAEFLHEFRLSAEKIAGELRIAYAAKQAENAGALAHKLKSSSRSVGALALGELCAQIEQAGKNGDFGSLALLLPKFEQELISVNNFLGRF